MEKYNNIKVFLFFLVLLVFIFGGFILMKKSTFTNSGNKIVELKPEDEKDIRLDDAKDYIYYTDVEHITSELDIEYKNVNLNFNDSNNIANLLNNETTDLRETLTIDETNEETVYNGLVSAKYKIYNNYIYDNFISLVVDYYEYHYETLVSYLSSKTYVFDKKTGNLLSSEEILNEYSLTKDDVINKVKTHIEDENIAKDGEELDAEATINNMTELNLFIDKIGRLSVSVLVKSDQKDYNEIIVLS